MIRQTSLGMLLGLAGIAITSSGAEQTEYRLHLERQSLFSAMQQLSSQTGLMILSTDPRVREVHVGPISGVYPVDHACRLLLAGTGFKCKQIDERIYAVTQEASGSRSDSTEPGSPSGLPSGSQAAPSAGPEQTPQGRPVQHEVVVPGKRISTLDTNVPIVVLSREAIERYGISSIADFLKYLPAQPYSRPESYSPDGGQYADLRGLGMDAATVMINGRWAPPTATSGTAFDLHTVPVTAVERVEVLLDSPATAVGSGAIGGVVNIVLNKSIPSPRVGVEYGTAAGGAAQRRISLGIGQEHRRLRGALSLDYFERDSLSGAQRSLWVDQDYRRFGGEDWRFLASQPGNISSLTGAPLPGLSSSFAAVPAGSSGIGLTPNDFEATAGQLNRTSLRRFSSVTPATRRVSAAATAELPFSHFKTFAELLYAERTSTFGHSPPVLIGVLVPATNPFNPFNEPVQASVLLSAIGPRQTEIESELRRLVLGAEGQLNSWSWELTALHSEEDALSWTDKELNATRVAQALAQSDPALALNLFQDGPGGSPELLSSLIGEPFFNVYSSTGTQATGSLQGPLFALADGDVSAMLGMQWREEAMSTDIGTWNDFDRAVHRTVATTLAELRAPLMRSLDLNLGGRWDHFSDLDPIFTWSSALAWQASPDLQLRVSYGTSFRVPTLYEISRHSVQIPISDPRRGGETASVTALIGSSPELKSVRGRSANVSATFTPSSFPDLRLSASYWRTLMSSRIMNVPIALLLEHEDDFSDRIVRDAPTEDDIAAGLPGQLSSIDLSRMNFTGVATSGIDAHASYRFDTRLGSFSTVLTATWIDEFISPGSWPTNRVGIADPRGTIPRWRALAAIDWRRGCTSLSAIVRGVAAYDDVSGTTRNGRSVPAQAIFDLHASLNLEQKLLEPAAVWHDTTMTAGILNVLDSAPAFAEVGQDLGYDWSQGDLKQRFVYVRLQKVF